MGERDTEQRKPAKRRWSRGQWRSLGIVLLAVMMYGHWGPDIEGNYPPTDFEWAVRGQVAFVVLWCLLELFFFSLVPFGKRVWKRLARSDTPNMSDMR